MVSGGGGHPKIFELKGGQSQKLRGKGDHAGKCAGLRGHSRENWGVMQNFSEIIKKPPPPPPPPPTHKKLTVPKGVDCASV